MFMTDSFSDVKRRIVEFGLDVPVCWPIFLSSFFSLSQICCVVVVCVMSTIIIELWLDRWIRERVVLCPFYQSSFTTFRTNLSSLSYQRYFLHQDISITIFIDTFDHYFLFEIKNTDRIHFNSIRIKTISTNHW